VTKDDILYSSFLSKEHVTGEKLVRNFVCVQVDLILVVLFLSTIITILLVDIIITEKDGIFPPPSTVFV
jgi:hypothetical protein